MFKLKMTIVAYKTRVQASTLRYGWWY